MEVLRGVDLTIRPGDLLSIMGPSGCGKSTLMNIIGLLDQQTSGTRWLDGRMIGTMTDDEVSAVRNARIGFVFQAFHLLPRLTAAQNAGLPLLYRGMREGEVRTRALAALETVDMAERSEHRPGQLSGGQQQRVALARALIGGPSIILADEPTGAPDPDTAAEVMATFERLCDEQRIAVVIVTHSPEVEARCRWRTRLEDGLPRETARGAHRGARAERARAGGDRGGDRVGDRDGLDRRDRARAGDEAVRGARDRHRDGADVLLPATAPVGDVPARRDHGDRGGDRGDRDGGVERDEREAQPPGTRHRGGGDTGRHGIVRRRGGP